VSATYPESIANVPEIQNIVSVQNGMTAGGETVARELITLPTHAYVREKDIDKIAAAVREIAKS
jgi:hypothetical protein